MSAQPPKVVRVVSSNVLPVPEGFDEPAVENKKETLEPLVGFGGMIPRTSISIQQFPANNSGPLPVATDPDFGVANPGGTNVYFLDLPPNFESPMHRTVTTDYLFVQSGTPTLVTPKAAFNTADGKASQETDEVTLQTGEMVVQRGQLHAWKNTTDSWVRLLCFIVHAQEPETGAVKDGQKVTLGESWL